MDPVFLLRDVTDDELSAEMATLRSGRYPRWQLAGEAGYDATEGPAGALEVYRYKRLWLRRGVDTIVVVTLRRSRHSAVWQRIADPDEENMGAPDEAT